MERTLTTPANRHTAARERTANVQCSNGRPPPPPGADGRWAEQAFELITQARRFSGRLPERWDRRARDLGKAIVNYRGARDSYARRVLFGMPRRRFDLLLVPFGGAQLLVPSEDDEIGRAVFATGGYESVYMACATAELQRLGVPVAGKTIVDVGANIGTSTVDALLNFGFSRAVCFEPDERSYRLLLANVAINGLADRVQAYAAALSATERSGFLELSPTNRADNRLVTDEEASRTPSDRVVGVPYRRFD